MSHSEHQLKAAMRQEMVERGLPLTKGTDMPPSRSSNDSGMKIPSVTIDFRIPLYQIVGAGCFFITGLIAMYYQLAQLTQNVSELQAAIKSNNAQVIQFAQAQALMQYRLEKLETETRADRK